MIILSVRRSYYVSDLFANEILENFIKKKGKKMKDGNCLSNSENCVLQSKIALLIMGTFKKDLS